MSTAGIQLELEKMINRCLMFIISGLTAATASVGGCIVHPTSVVVTDGERVLLNCTTREGDSISSWRIGKDNIEENTIYTAPIYTKHGTIGTPEKVAEGYFAIRPVDSETGLYMNRTRLSQAGLYICTCNLRVTAETTVVILDSEPKFTANKTGVEGDPVTFSCSMSFNASSDVSCDIRMDDASGSTVARRSECNLRNELIVCNLEYMTIANACPDQCYICNVSLSIKGDIIYSRVLKVTDEWQSISSTADYLTNGGAQTERGNDTPQRIATVLSVTIIAVCIIIAAVVYFIIRSKNIKKLSTRQLSMAQSMEQSSNHPQRSADRYDENSFGSPISKTSAASSFDVAQQDKKTLKENELILCENDLYSTTPKRLDPSDGYYTDEKIYNEIQ